MSNLQQLLAVAAFVIAALSLVGAGMLIWRARKERTAGLSRAQETGPHKPTSEPNRPSLVDSVRKVGEFAGSGGYSQKLRENLALAGFHSSSAPATFMGLKIVLFVVGVALGLFLGVQLEAPMYLKATLAMFVAGLLFMIPNFVVSHRRTKRKEETHRFLPDAIDLLEICVSSGMGLDQAWNAVSEEIRRVSPVLADEMELTNLEISLGVERAKAMRHMSDRTGAEEISSLVALMIQADRFGASIVEALKTFAGSMREVSSKKAEESAEKMAVKLLAPMVLCIFPALLIVMVGPAVMRISDVMG